MEKKCFVALLMVVVMMCACWTGAVAEDERDYQYALLDDGTVEITGYNGKAEKLTIPNMLNVIFTPSLVARINTGSIISVTPKFLSFSAHFP